MQVGALIDLRNKIHRIIPLQYLQIYGKDISEINKRYSIIFSESLSLINYTENPSSFWGYFKKKNQIHNPKTVRI